MLKLDIARFILLHDTHPEVWMYINVNEHLIRITSAQYHKCKHLRSFPEIPETLQSHVLHLDMKGTEIVCNKDNDNESVVQSDNDASEKNHGETGQR